MRDDVPWLHAQSYCCETLQSHLSFPRVYSLTLDRYIASLLSSMAGLVLCLLLCILKDDTSGRRLEEGKSVELWVIEAVVIFLFICLGVYLTKRLVIDPARRKAQANQIGAASQAGADAMTSVVCGQGTLSLKKDEVGGAKAHSGQISDLHVAAHGDLPGSLRMDSSTLSTCSPEDQCRSPPIIGPPACMASKRCNQLFGSSSSPTMSCTSARKYVSPPRDSPHLSQGPLRGVRVPPTRYACPSMCRIDEVRDEK